MDFSYSYSSDLTQMSPGAAIACCVVCLGLSIFILIAMAKIFKKAGKPGWHVIIPFLNAYDEFDIAEGKGIRFLLLLIPIYNIYVLIKFYIDLAKSFGKDGGFAAGLIFLGPIFIAILGFGSAQYIGPMGVPANTANDGFDPNAYPTPDQQPPLQ